MTGVGASPSWTGPRGRAIDPLPVGHPGCYADDAVVVERATVPLADVARGPYDRVSARTAHFVLGSADGRLRLVHSLRPADLDDDLAGLLDEELFASGWASGSGTFERLFTGIVVSAGAGADAGEGWEAFYRNSLRSLAGERPSRAGGTLAEFGPVYERALAEIPPGTVLDLGSCFGFLPLRLAERGASAVVASDISAGSMHLLETMGDRLGIAIETLVCDAAIVPLPDRAVDTVSAVHLLEHVDAEHGERVLAEAMRLARRRVVVAVPFEEVPNAAYGHVRTLTLDDLTALGAASGWRYRVSEDAGGWLVLERPARRRPAVRARDGRG